MANGRTSVEVTEALRLLVSAGQTSAGRYMPTTRELSRQHGVSNHTVIKALKTLESEGVLKCEPRHGYRVTARANDPNRGCPIAFLLSSDNLIGGTDSFYSHLGRLIAANASKRGWETVKVVIERDETRSAFERLKQMQCGGVILDTVYPDVLAKARHSGLPTVVVDAWDPTEQFDAVVQDDFGGGELASSYLLSAGHTRIAWLGPNKSTYHAAKRFSGAASAMADAGLSFLHDIRLRFSDPGLAAAARAMLGSPQRPTAVLALWQPMLSALLEAARELGIAPGRDLAIVGWCAEEVHESSYVPLFGKEAAAPAVVWSVASMAAAAVSRLAERRAHPDPGCVRTSIPVRMKTVSNPEGAILIGDER
jgi:DNA-binding LacI/PurR family transcriptional regulator